VLESSRPVVTASSRIPGFFRLGHAERVATFAERAGLGAEDRALLGAPAALGVERADHMIENCVGTFELPLGIATNFVINGREVLVPMSVEEPSVLAAASAGALAARAGGGFVTSSTERRMIGQIQVVDCPDFDAARARLEAAAGELTRLSEALQGRMIERGGGTRAVHVRDLGADDGPFGRMLVVQLVIDTVDAMGANLINTVAEGLAPRVEAISGGRVLLRILSNYVDECLARARMEVPPSVLAQGSGPDDAAGAEVVDGIVRAYHFAALDTYRAVTHNKGVMNGVDAVVIATGNDWRAIEAGAHAYAARSGRYGPMTHWHRDARGWLVGEIELPMPVGLVGGSTRVHPMARLAVKALGVRTARELAEVVVAVGLAQNFSAIRALATDGIQKGHMALHARTLAATAGARGEQVDVIARRLVALGDIRLERASTLLAELEPVEVRTP
jgi:hydroxymethylglutaryl-CoA reductase